MSRKGSADQLSILYLALDVDVGRMSGEGAHVLEVVGALRDQGHRITLVLPNTEGNVHVAMQLETNRMGVLLIERASALRQALRIRSKAKKVPCDIIYERRFVPKVGVVLSFLLDIPLVVEVNAIMPIDAELYSGRRRRLLAPIRVERAWHSFLLSMATIVVTVTPGLAQALQADYGLSRERIKILSNAANAKVFRPLDRKYCRVHLGLPEGVHIVCFVGDLAPWHGVDVLLEAVSTLVGEGMLVHSLIVGDGILRDTLRALAKKLQIENLVHWVGRVPHERVPEYVGAGDIAVAPIPSLPTKTSVGSSALKIFEYMACGRAVITTEFVVEAQKDLSSTLVLVAPGDARALAAAIKELLSDPVRCRDLGARSRRMVEEKYNWERAAEKLSGLLLSAERLRTRNRG